MCGLAGVFTTERETGLTMTEQNIFRELLLISTVRGLDGSGILYAGDVATGWDRPEAAWVKVDGHPFDLFTNNLYLDDLKNINNSRYMAGHVRPATKGEVSENNAHPFEIGDIIGMHNGTLSDIECYEDFKKHTVDSEAIIASLAQNPDSPVETLESLVGAAAIVWYNQKDHSLNIWKNHQRPLFATKVGPTYFYASERQMLAWILNRNSTSFVGDIIEVTLEFHYKWVAGESRPTTTKIEREYTKYKKTPVYRGSLSPHGQWSRRDDEDGDYHDFSKAAHRHESYQRTTTTGEEGAEKDEKGTKKVVPIRDASTDTGGSIVHLPAEKHARTAITTQNYHGLRVGAEVVFEATTTEFLDDEKLILSLTGDITTILDNTPLNPLVENVRIRAIVKGVAPEDLEKILEAEMLVADVRNIVLSIKDVTDVVVWVSDVQVFDYDEYVEQSNASKAAAGKGNNNNAC